VAKNHGESDVEGDCKDLAKKEYNLWGVKLKFLNINGAPDHLFLGMNRFFFFVEFKKPNKKARGNQTYIHKILIRCGFGVHVIDNVKDFRKACEIERTLHTQRLHNGSN